MYNMLEFIEGIQSNPIGAIIIIILFFAGAKQVYEFFVWLLGLLNLYHKKQTQEEKIEEMVMKVSKLVDQMDTHSKEQDKRLDEMKKNIEYLSKTDTQQKQSIKDLHESLELMKSSIDELREDNKEQVIASYSSTLYNLYTEAMERGYTDKAALESFSKLSDIYLKCGGNSVFKHKIIPQYLALPIKDIK